MKLVDHLVRVARMSAMGSEDIQIMLTIVSIVMSGVLCVVNNLWFGVLDVTKLIFLCNEL